MTNETPVKIEPQDWMPIPPELRDGLISHPLSKRRLRNWTLVLQARQIPCRSEPCGRGWLLLVPVEQYAAACEQLRSFEEENRNWPPPPPAERPQQENTLSTIWLLIALGVFHLIAQHQLKLFHLPSIDWIALGNADAGKILAGEWWRLVTALTLHSDGLHLAGNLVIGGLFVNRLCRDLGSGLGWSLVLGTGILGNLVNACVQSPDHRSIGASTAVFGAVGLLAAINLLRYRSNLYRRWPMPVAAALALLALLGAGGENTDIGAHLFGFGFGIGLGLATELFSRRGKQPSPTFNQILAVTAFLLILCAWLKALAQGPAA